MQGNNKKEVDCLMKLLIKKNYSLILNKVIGLYDFANKLIGSAFTSQLLELSDKTYNSIGKSMQK